MNPTQMTQEQAKELLEILETFGVDRPGVPIAPETDTFVIRVNLEGHGRSGCYGKTVIEAAVNAREWLTQRGWKPTRITPTHAPSEGQAGETMWLVWSHEHNAWWRPNSAGYTMHIATAGRYTKQEADRICESRSPRKFADDPPPEVAVIAPEAESAITALRASHSQQLAAMRLAFNKAPHDPSCKYPSLNPAHQKHCTCWKFEANKAGDTGTPETDKVSAKLSERKTVHEWLNALHIPTEENGKALCLLRRLRITCDLFADLRAQPSPDDVMMIRCLKCLTVPQQNKAEATGGECGGCIAKERDAARASHSQLEAQVAGLRAAIQSAISEMKNGGGTGHTIERLNNVLTVYTSGQAQLDRLAEAEKLRARLDKREEDVEIVMTYMREVHSVTHIDADAISEKMARQIIKAAHNGSGEAYDAFRRIARAIEPDAALSAMRKDGHE
jgi:hypothetical protein